MLKTLLLNSDFKPLDIISWKKSLVMWLGYKNVTLIDVYPEVVRDGQGKKYHIPAVLALHRYFSWTHEAARFTKSNIFARDDYTCQYCGDKLLRSSLTIDHVIPKSQFRIYEVNYKCNSFWNVVTACYSCNARKGDRTPVQAKMQLLKMPKSVTIHQIFINKLKSSPIPNEWKPYL